MGFRLPGQHGDRLVSDQEAYSLVMDAVRRHFRPEFINRIDEIVVFHRLQRDQMGAIVDIQIKRLQKLLDDRKIVLELDTSARNWLAEKGYEPAYGARPLKRVIQKNVQDKLAEAILSGESRTEATVKITAGPDGIHIDEQPAVAAA